MDLLDRCLPDGEELLLLEEVAKKSGSGIEGRSLLGLWNFLLVWPKGKSNEDLIKSTILRFFSASLELRLLDQHTEHMPFEIVNSVSFFFFKVQFKGLANLRGKQPLISFYFDRFEITVGSKILFEHNISKQNESEWPFFSLIAIGKSEHWLAARGRGGGLALWLKKSNQQSF